MRCPAGKSSPSKGSNNSIWPLASTHAAGPSPVPWPYDVVSSYGTDNTTMSGLPSGLASPRKLPSTNSSATNPAE